MLKQPYPEHAYLERDPETNESRWYSTRGMGVKYVREDCVADAIDDAVQAEREACAKIADVGMLVPPDGGSPTQDEIDVAKGIAAAIRNRT